MSAATQPFVVPDLCNVTAVTLVVLFAQLLVLVLWVTGTEVTWLRFALLSLFVQWVSLSSAGLLCALRGWLARLQTVAGAVVAFLLVLLITFVEGIFADRLLVQFAPVPVDWPRIGVMLLVAAIISGLALRYFHVQQRLRAKEQSELQARLQALQSRIRPHFLFNSMNIIASLIAVDPETAETVVEDLSELFRASLNEAGNQVSVATELDLCERYVRIESLRLGDRLCVEWDVDPLPESARIPLLTVQPLLENAIYHGIQPRAEGGTVSVGVHCENDSLRIEITNPLAPADARSDTQGNRMALENIRSRLNVLFGDAAELRAGAEGDCFRTIMRFPLHGARQL
ncbi:MAG: histidine kinase [Pseudomonadales bacterium]|nr:histidine kinase [Pseudomonadales bacterium]MCP5184111.1 histidine kinase [Pseudomonadales bacterium]